MHMEYGEVELRRGVALPGRLLEPFGRHAGALWDAYAAGIETAEDELRLGISELGRGAVPDRCLLHVRRRALAEIVHSRQAQHGRRMTVARGLAKTGFSGEKILRQTLPPED